MVLLVLRRKSKHSTNQPLILYTRIFAIVFYLVMLLSQKKSFFCEKKLLNLPYTAVLSARDPSLGAAAALCMHK